MRVRSPTVGAESQYESAIGAEFAVELPLV
jgi:hypothetical protein